MTTDRPPNRGNPTGKNEVPGRNKAFRVRLARELPAVLCIAILSAVLVKSFLLQAFYIPSPSMAPTLLVDDRVLVSKLSRSFERGKLIVFDSPLHKQVAESLHEKVARNLREVVGLQHPTAHLIKRVVAAGGEQVEIREGQILVNGTAQVESYFPESSQMEDMMPRFIPVDHLWVMGDNRNR